MRINVFIFLFLTVGFVAKGNRDKSKAMDKNKQVFTFSAQIQDAASGEIISGANIILEDGTAISTNFDGVFKLKLGNSKPLKVKINAIGYKITETEISPLTLDLTSVSLQSL